MNENPIDEFISVIDEVLATTGSEQDVRTDTDPAAWFDWELFARLGDIGAIGIGVDDALGGSGLGFGELTMILSKVGEHASRVPLLAATCLGTIPLARFSATASTRSLLERALSGDIVITTALLEPGNRDLSAPTTSARQTDGGWQISGRKSSVLGGVGASHVIIPADTPTGLGLFIVGTDDEGLTAGVVRTARGEPELDLELNDVTVGASLVLAEPPEGASALRVILDHASLGICAVMNAASRAAMHATVDHTSQRHQFGRSLASFQAVNMHVADMAIALHAAELALLAALPSSPDDDMDEQAVDVACYWAGQAADTAVTESHRLHGGVGVDVTHALATLTLLSRQLQTYLGSPSSRLATIGNHLAAKV